MKRLLSIALVIFVLLSLTITASADTDTAVRNKKIVSIVYDDSGSMAGNNWVQANYAMQTFASMLNKEDELYITYMNSMGGSQKIDTADLNNAVKDIRNHSDSGGTPYSAVQEGISTLRGISDNNLNTQYWLVVFTDGGFNDADLPEVERDISSFAKETMPNNSNPSVYYLTLGDISGSYTPSVNAQNVQVVSTSNNDDISKNMFSMASEISGRYPVDSKDIKSIDDKTIEITADIPLLNIGIMTQNTKSKVDKIKSDEDIEIPIKSSISISAPDKSISMVSSASEDVLNMFGNMTLAGLENKNIPAGKYRITFSDKIDTKNLLILFEPAITLRITLFKDGKEITDPDSIPKNATGISAKADLCEFGTNNVILPSLLPNGIEYSMVHTEDDKEIEKSDKLELNPLTITSGVNVVTATAKLPGCFNLVQSIEFTPRGLTCDRIVAEVLGDGSERMKDENGNPDGEEVVYLTLLESNKTGIKFTLYEDGAPIDKSTAVAVEDEFKAGIKSDFPFYDVEILSDGSFLVYPTKTSFLYNPIIEYAFHHGEQSVGVDVGGAQASEKLIFKLGDGWWWALLQIILPLYFIWWLLFKKHLPRGSLSYFSAHVDTSRSYSTPNYVPKDYIRTGWFGAFKSPLFILPKLIVLLLPTASKVKFYGYTFIGQQSLVHRGNMFFVVKNVKNKAVSSSNPRPSRESTDSKTDLDSKLFIKESEVSFTKFEFD